MHILFWLKFWLDASSLSKAKQQNPAGNPRNNLLKVLSRLVSRDSLQWRLIALFIMHGNHRSFPFDASVFFKVIRRQKKSCSDAVLQAEVIRSREIQGWRIDLRTQKEYHKWHPDSLPHGSSGGSTRTLCRSGSPLDFLAWIFFTEFPPFWPFSTS